MITFTIAEISVSTSFEAWPAAINDNGYVGGTTKPIGGSTVTNPSRAFLWNPATALASILPDTDGQGATAGDINNMNQMVGLSFYGPPNQTSWKAVRWDNVVGVQDIGSFGTGVRPLAEARSINSNGQVAGGSWNDEIRGTRGFLWDPGTQQLTDVGVLNFPNVNSSSAFAVNDQAQVVGASAWLQGQRIHAFLWDQLSGMTDLGHLGGDSSLGVDINNKGQVVGSSRLANGDSHAFLWDPVAANMKDLGTLGGHNSQPAAINKDGYVVGGSVTSGGAGHATLWHGNTIQDLNTSLSGGAGWVLQWASGVNNHRQIVGWGLYNGKHAGFLLTPVPIDVSTRFIVQHRIFDEVSKILFGIVNDQRGVYIGPDGRPHPVDPWGPLTLAPGPERDVALGILLSEMSPLIHDREVQKQARRLSEQLLATGGQLHS